MSLDVRATGLPRLEVEVDLHARLLLADRAGDLDHDSVVTIRPGLAIDAPKELE